MAENKYDLTLPSGKTYEVVSPTPMGPDALAGAARFLGKPPAGPTPAPLTPAPAKPAAGIGPSEAAADVLAGRAPAPETREGRKNYEPFVAAAVEELYPGSRFIDIIHDDVKLEAVRARATEKAAGVPAAEPAPTKIEAPVVPEPGLASKIGQRAVDAAKKTAALPWRTVKLATGAQKPEDPFDWGLMLLAHAPLIAAGGAGAAAIPGLARIPGLAAAAGRSLTSGGIAGGQAAVQGESPWLPAALGTLASGIVEGGGAALGNLVGRVARPAARETARAAETTRIGKDIGKVLPELETAGDVELFGAAKEWGAKHIEKVLQPSLREIEKRLTLTTPTGTVHAKLSVPSLDAKGTVSIKTALDGFFDADGKTKGAIRREIVGELDRLDPQKVAGQIFDGALKARAAGYAYLSAIKRATNRDGLVDPEKLRAVVNRDGDKLARFAGDYWPLVRRALLGPTVATTGPVPSRFLPEASAVSIPGLGSLGRFTPPMPMARGAESVASMRGMQPLIDALVSADPTLSEGVVVGAGMAGKAAAEHTPGLGRIFRGSESQ